MAGNFCLKFQNIYTVVSLTCHTSQNKSFFHGFESGVNYEKDLIFQMIIKAW